MKDCLLHPDIALMNLVLDISTKTSSVATIRSGKITLSNGNITIDFEFFKEDFHHVVFSDRDECWHFYLSLNKFTETKHLEKTIIFILGSDSENRYNMPIISIPRLLYYELMYSKRMLLDYLFNPTSVKALIKYSIIQKNNRWYFQMFYKQKMLSKTEIIVVPRDGIGNEEL